MLVKFKKKLLEYYKYTYFAKNKFIKNVFTKYVIKNRSSVPSMSNCLINATSVGSSVLSAFSCLTFLGCFVLGIVFLLTAETAEK